MFPEEINKYIDNLSFEKNNIGRSNDEVYIFEDKYILKISNNSNRLLDEKDRVDFLSRCNIPGSESICYIEDNNKYYYLRTYIKGDTLIHKRFINNPLLLIDILVDVVKVLRSLDKYNCPFKSKESDGSFFVHGDLCLPNIVVDDKNNFVGFIDLDNAGLGDKWFDYSWLLWSLEYNLKTNKYNIVLLDKLGIEFNKYKYDKYIPEEYRK